jgi:hypothetical protein
VQTAGAGITAVTLTPKYGYASDQIVSITTDQLYIDDTDVMLFPTVTTRGVLLAGEVYSITVSSSAFTDMTSNPYAGLTAGWTISTKRLVDFAEASTTSGEWGAGISYFTGERYGSAGMVDSTNTIYMIGGVNGTSGAPANNMMNDIWSFATQRETRCASSFVSLGACPQTTCSIGADGQPNLGTMAVKKTVWRAPSASGAPCMDGATEVRNLWSTVTSEMQSCPCPMCLTAPGADGTPLPTSMVNTSYVEAYTLISAAPPLSMQPLHCQDGFAPSGPFTCVVDTPYIGKYQTPYPECLTAPCTSPPTVSGENVANAEDTAGSTDGINCGALNETYTMKHGGLCAIKCIAGYAASGGGYKCHAGTFSGSGSCEKQACDGSIIKQGSLVGMGCSSPKLGSRCTVKCAEGYKTSSASVTATCGTQSDEPEAPVSLKLSSGTPSTVCQKIECSTPMTSNGAFKLTSGDGITAIWNLECNEGYLADAGFLAKCSGDGTLLNSDGDATLPSCSAPPPCTGGDAVYQSVDGAEGSTCSATMSDGDKCTVTCGEGLTATGDFVCLSGEITGIATCYDSTSDLQVEEVQMIASTLKMSMDLSGIDIADAKAAVSKSLASALGVDAADVIVGSIKESGSRRLDASSPRRLAAAAYDISYQVVVPDGTDPSSLITKATDIGTPGSAASSAFTSAMESEALPVSGIELVAAPRQFTATVVKSSDGSIVTPAPDVSIAVPSPPPGGSTAPAPAEEESSESGGGGMGAVIGGVVGGLFGLGIVGFLVYWFVIRKKSQQE